MKIVKNLLLGLGFLAIGLGSGQAWQHAVRWLDEQNVIRPLDRAGLGIPSDQRVVMLSLSTCPVCRHARQWLAENQIEHAEWVIDESDSAQKMASLLHVKAVPLFLIGDQQMTGFNPAALQTLLNAGARASRAP
jgi:glutaredoxin 3